jgi:hypothetical protein
LRSTELKYTVYWGRDNAMRVRTHAQLHELLTVLAVVPGLEGAPHAVDLLPAGAEDGGLQIGFGHPDRAFVMALDAAGGFAVRSELEAWPEPIAFDCGNEVIDFKPAWTRITPDDAVRAAHEYVETGKRPANLVFDTNA